MIELINLSKSYDEENLIVNSINLKINKGEIISLIGKSGSGKSTILRMLNRLIEPSAGKVLINGKDTNEENLLELRRNMGYVIQKVGLFPHLNIMENITIVAKTLGWEQSKLTERSIELLKLVDLDPTEYLYKYPDELSGGQQQRVGVARALCLDPDIILMDEPFSALDPITRENLQEEILFLQEKLQKTIVFVTHDMDEALKISDRIAFLQEGRLEQVGTPEEILKNPANNYIRNFVGATRLWQSPEYLYIKDIMNREPFLIGESRKLIQAAELMREKHTSTLFVVNNIREKKFAGVLSVDQINSIDLSEYDDINVSDIMATDEVVVLNENDSLVKVFDLIKTRNFNGLAAVISMDNELTGLITSSDILNIISEMAPRVNN